MAVPGPGSVHGRDLQAGTLAEGAISLRALVLSDPVIPLLGIDPKEVIKDSPRMAVVVSTTERKVPTETELSPSQAVSTAEYYTAVQTQGLEGRLGDLGKCPK